MRQMQAVSKPLEVELQCRRDGIGPVRAAGLPPETSTVLRVSLLENKGRRKWGRWGSGWV